MALFDLPLSVGNFLLERYSDPASEPVPVSAAGVTLTTTANSSPSSCTTVYSSPRNCSRNFWTFFNFIFMPCPTSLSLSMLNGVTGQMTYHAGHAAYSLHFSSYHSFYS